MNVFCLKLLCLCANILSVIIGLVYWTVLFYDLNKIDSLTCKNASCFRSITVGISLHMQNHILTDIDDVTVTLYPLCNAKKRRQHVSNSCESSSIDTAYITVVSTYIYL